MDLPTLMKHEEAVKWLRERVKPLTENAISNQVVIKGVVDSAVKTSNRVKALLEKITEFIPPAFTFSALISIFVVTGYILWYVFF